MDYSGWTIVSDYDNTLTKVGEHLIAPYTRRAINYFISHKGRFLICTARVKVELDAYVKGLIRTNTPFIFCNGALIQNSVDGRVLYSKPLPSDFKSLTGEIIRRFPDLNVYVAAKDKLSLVNFAGYSERFLAELEDFYGVKAGKTLRKKCDFELGAFRSWDVRESLDEIGGDYYKIMLQGLAERVTQAREFLEGQRFGHRYNICSSFPCNAEIVSGATGKGAALRWLMRKSGLRNVVVLGDGENDVEMFAEGSFSITPAVASSSAKNAADIVCGTKENIMRRAIKLIEDNMMEDKGERKSSQEEGRNTKAVS